MNNERLKEIKLAIYINHIDKSKSSLTYSNIMKLLSCLAAAFGEDAHNSFTKLVQSSIADGFMDATNKELIATCKTYFSNRKASSLLDIAEGTYYNRYGEYIYRDYVNEEYLAELKPKLDNTEIVNIMLQFFDNFNFELGNDDHDLKYHERSLELEFWLIYDKLMSLYRSSTIIDKFLFNMCNLFDMDYGTIANLKNNIHIINRTYPNYKYNNRYFMQEFVYLYTKKNVGLCIIASRVLGKNRNFFYIGTNRKYTELIKEDTKEIPWQYSATLDWKNMNKGSVSKLIDLFHQFIKYEK